MVFKPEIHLFLMLMFHVPPIQGNSRPVIGPPIPSIPRIPGWLDPVINQAGRVSVSRLHCTLGFDDPALHLLVGSQTFQFFAVQAPLETKST